MKSWGTLRPPWSSVASLGLAQFVRDSGLGRKNDGDSAGLASQCWSRFLLLIVLLRSIGEGDSFLRFGAGLLGGGLAGRGSRGAGAKGALGLSAAHRNILGQQRCGHTGCTR